MREKNWPGAGGSRAGAGTDLFALRSHYSPNVGLALATFAVTAKRLTPRGRIRLTVRFGDGASIEVRDRALLSQGRFRRNVRLKLGRELPARSPVEWRWFAATALRKLDHQDE